jgi:hypothetical protein
VLTVPPVRSVAGGARRHSNRARARARPAAAAVSRPQATGHRPQATVCRRHGRRQTSSFGTGQKAGKARRQARRHCRRHELPLIGNFRCVTSDKMTFCRRHADVMQTSCRRHADVKKFHTLTIFSGLHMISADVMQTSCRRHDT